MTETITKAEAVAPDAPTLRPYPAYKPSGIDWFTEVPDHWRVDPLKRLLRRNDSGAWGDEGSDSGIPVLRSTEQTIDGRWRLESPALRKLSPRDYARTRLFSGDLVVTTSSGSASHIGKATLVTDEMENVGYAFSNFMQRLTPGSFLLPKLFWYLVNSPIIKGQLGFWSTTTTGLANLNGGILGSLIVPLPPADEQRAIADFLDAMDVRITRLIDARRRMIELLEEQKQAIITQAVTKGLVPDVPMKPSGIDWLGDIPAHWRVLPLRHAVSSSVAGLWGDDPTIENEPDHIRCIRVADFDIPNLGISDDKSTMRAIPLRARANRLLADGDILLEKSGGGDNQPVGRVVQFKGSTSAVTSNFVTRLRVNPAIATSNYVLRLMDVLQRLRITAYSIKQTTGIQNLDERHYLTNSVPFPPLKEQSRILQFIEAVDSQLNDTQERYRREVSLIQEYRTRLISDVVTGKLDVRGVEP